MPNIRTFTSTRDDTRPVADRSGEIIGQAVAQFGEQIAQTGTEVGMAIQRRDDRRDTSGLTKKATETQTQLLKDWQEQVRTADPDDKELASRFMSDTFGPAMEKLGEEGGFSPKVQDHLDNLKVSMQAHFDRKTFKDSNDLVGQAAAFNFEKSITELSTQAMLDPEGVDGYLDMLAVLEDGFIAAGGSRSVALKMREDAEKSIATGAINGFIEEDPMGAKANLDAGIFSDLGLSTAEQKQLSRYAGAVHNSRKAEARRVNSDNAALTSSNLLSESIGGKSEEDLIKQLPVLPGYQTPEGATEQRIMYNLFTTSANRKASGKTGPVLSNAKYQELYDRAFLEQDNQNFISRTDVLRWTDVPGGISREQARWILDSAGLSSKNPGQIVKAEAAKDYFKGIDQQFLGTQLRPIKSPAAARIHALFSSTARTIIQEEEAAGKTVEEIYSADGRLAQARALPQFQLSNAAVRASLRAQRAEMRGQTGSSDAKQEGESIEQWKKRTGK